MPISPSLSSIFSPTKRPNRNIPFKDYYSKWFTTLKTTILPLLHGSIASTSITSSSSSSLSSSSQSLLTSHVHLLLHHLFSYYDTLDLLATTNPSASLPLLLFPPWRNHLERPFLFLGDFHPYIFTNLIRSQLNDEEDEEEEECEDLGGSSSGGRNAKRVAFDGNWKLADMAWKDPPEELLLKIDQIERGLRLMVPALVDRAHKAQTGFVKEVVKEWLAQDDHDSQRELVDGASEAMKTAMEELARVFLDANRLRRTVVSDIVGALSLFQGALFLEGLAQFLVGFQDPDWVRWFNKCKTPITD